MLNIDKGAPPKSWKMHAATPGAKYAATQKLKDALLKEQGYLCCYCMRRITAETMKVEHWAPQSVAPARQLDYGNLLAACRGGEGENPGNACCDTSKKDRLLKYNPADPGHDVEAVIVYRGDGRLAAPRDSEFEEQLDRLLRLNQPMHCNNRKSVRRAVITVLGMRKRWGRGDIHRELAQWRSPDRSMCLKEYAGVAIYFLQKKADVMR